MINIIAVEFFNGGFGKRGFRREEELKLHRERRISTGDGFVRLSMYLTIHLSRLETESQNQTHQTHPDDGGNDRTVLYLQRWLRKNRGFLRRGKGGGGRCKEQETEREKNKSCKSRLSKNLELSPINLALYISLSPIQVFNLKSA